MVGDKRSIVETFAIALVSRRGTRELEVIPGHLQTQIACACIVVGVRIVEAPVGDADIHTLAVVSEVIDDAETLVYTVGAGVETVLVAFGGGNGMRDAVLYHLFGTLQQWQGFNRDTHGDNLPRLGSEDDTGFLENGAVEVRCHFGQHVDMGGTGGYLFCNQSLRVDTAFLILRSGAH